jgi:hypothetical protein
MQNRWYADGVRKASPCARCGKQTKGVVVTDDGYEVLCGVCWGKPDKLEAGACPRAYAAARQLVKAGLISTSLPMGPDELLDVLAEVLEPFTLNREIEPDGCEVGPYPDMITEQMNQL